MGSEMPPHHIPDLGLWVVDLAIAIENFIIIRECSGMCDPHLVQEGKPGKALLSRRGKGAWFATSSWRSSVHGAGGRDFRP